MPTLFRAKWGFTTQFYSYFKDKKIYVSDDLKKALSGDDYKELLNKQHWSYGQRSK
ncbi:MAG: hypothetical protein ACLVBP_15480 [Ruminococcus sp.]